MSLRAKAQAPKGVMSRSDSVEPLEEHALARHGVSPLTVLLLAALLTAIFVLVNPHFNGDAPFYAVSLAESGRASWTPGHALWEPATFLLISACRLFGLQLDTLLAMQLLSGAATAALVLITWDFCGRLGLSSRVAIGTAALLACTANSLVMGGGGYAATSLSLATMVAARALLHRDGTEWGVGDAAFSVFALVLGWGAWGVAVLAYPLIFAIAVMTSSGTPLRRAVRGASLVVTAGLASLVLAAIIWRGPADAQGLGLLAWLRSASHSMVFVPPDLADLIRPGLGVIRAFVEVGTFGFSIKAMLLGDRALVDPSELVRWSAVLLLVGVLVGRALIGLAGRVVSGDSMARRAALLAVVAVVPTYMFSIFYGGTEYHMHSTALPFLCMALVVGLDALPPLRIAPIQSAAGVSALVLIVGGSNFIGTCLPDIRSGEGFPWPSREPRQGSFRERAYWSSQGRSSVAASLVLSHITQGSRCSTWRVTWITMERMPGNPVYSARCRRVLTAVDRSLFCPTCWASRHQGG